MIGPIVSDPAFNRAFAGAIFVALSGAPLGVLLVLRRMSLMGDVIAHAILPGTAAGFLLAGMSYAAMGVGGLIAGLIVALVAGVASRFTAMREDASLVSAYLLAVACGILLLAAHGSAQDLEDVLFGDAKSINQTMIIVMAAVTTFTIVILAIIYRPLVLESFDPIFMKSVRGRGGIYHILFMVLVVLNMVEGYRALGTLMASGLLIMPAVLAQFWARRLSSQLALAVVFDVIGASAGLWLAFAYKVPSGPSIILTLGIGYLISVLFGRFGSVRARYFPFRHLVN